MKTLGNIIWVVFGGLHIALEYFIAGLILMITIIGIPFGLQSLKLGMLAIWPFGTKVKWKPSQPGCLSIFMNVLWLFVGGIWIWLTHIFYGLIFCITIIGIPFGKMHFRLAKLALSPFGKEVVYIQSAISTEAVRMILIPDCNTGWSQTRGLRLKEEGLQKTAQTAMLVNKQSLSQEKISP